MREFIYVTGMIIKQAPIGEYDRRVSILTKEKGKISAFVKGVRKTGNRLAAATAPFSFGTFKLYVGKNSYTMIEADIRNYFEELREDYIGAYFGIYFLEVADYYSRENNDDSQMLKLLYQSLRAICAPSLDNRLVKCIFEIKAIVINGEFPGPPYGCPMGEAAQYAVHYIETGSIEKLYTFTVTEDVLVQLEEFSRISRQNCMGHPFKSLEILKSLY